ncbi:MAG: site-2 protease family protein, partial [Clostridiales bacterium]|nr:site-2 protease family protein [Clostridiales bacterium]
MITNLLISGAWRTVGSIVLAILILLVMITIHEFGHYIAGKILHFKIDEFSIGFGPALFKKKNKKSGELFALRLIPLGGYCAFHGEDGLEDEKKEKEKQQEPFPEVAEGETAEVKAEETEVKPEEGETAPAKAAVEDEGAFTKKKPWQRIIVLVAGALMNYVLALFLILICFFSYGQTMMAVYEVEASEEIPVEYCLHDRDVFLKANGKNLYLTTDLVRALNGKKAGDKVEFFLSRVVDTVTETDAEGNEKKKFIREEMTVEIILRADVNVKNSAEIDSMWAALGVRFDDEQQAYMLASSTHKFGFFETLGRSFAYSFKIAGSIFKIIGELLTGKLGISALGGPVTTVAMTAQVASQSFRSFLEIASYIGVNLAVFNLLPIPALDGSKVVFTVIEW